MRPTRTKPENFSLEELLADIDMGLIALPDFQRDFDWTEKDVQALLVTVLTGWPIGSLLLMAGRPEYLELRRLEDGPAISSTGDLSYVILDGQQRLTALYQALYGKGPHVYAIHLPALGEGTVDELEESVRYYDQQEWRTKLGRPGAQYSEGLLPLYALRTAADFFAWRDAVLADATEDDELALREQLTDYYRNVLSGLHRYQVPAISLPSKIAPRAVARIFERVNKTGMRLEAFDLVVARSFTASWNLRRKYEEARLRHPIIDAFLGDDGIPILQSMSLRMQHNVRESAVIELPGEDVRRHWDAAVLGTARALEFLVDEGGVKGRSYLPYSAMLVVLAALAQEDGLVPRVDRTRDWYWGTVFTQSYDVASNTRSVADYRGLIGDTSGPLNFERRPIVREAIRTGTRRSSGAIWRGFLCMLMRANPLDLESGDPLLPTGEATAQVETRIDAVSLFPRSTPNADDDGPPHLRALGFVLGQVGASRRLGHGRFLESLSRHEVDVDRIDAALRSQLLPPTTAVDYRTLDWQELIDLRLAELEPLLSEATSASIVDYEPIEDSA